MVIAQAGFWNVFGSAMFLFDETVTYMYDSSPAKAVNESHITANNIYFYEKTNWMSNLIGGKYMRTIQAQHTCQNSSTLLRSPKSIKPMKRHFENEFHPKNDRMSRTHTK